MRVQIRGQNLKVSNAVREHVERRLEFALGRFDRAIQSVSVRVSDLNGPRGGDDKSCQVIVNGQAGWTVVIEERQGAELAAVDLAAERAGRSVARQLDRVKDARAA